MPQMLDYTLKTQEERNECAYRVVAETPDENMTNAYKKSIADYLLFLTENKQTKKERKKQRPILTKNRQITINKRQVSYDEIVDCLENGEDGIYNLMSNDNDQLLDNKEPISQQDIDEIPGIRDYLDIIERLRKQFPSAVGKQKYYIKKQIIETYQQIYILKASYRGWPAKSKVSAQLKSMAHMNLEEHVTFDDRGFPVSDGIISMFNPVHISFLLSYYSALKQESYEDLQGDMRWLMLDLDEIIEAMFHDEPVLLDLLIWKIDGYSNEEICGMMEQEHGETHSAQYYSTIWRKRIPKMIAEQAQKKYLLWYYNNVEYGNWKKCGKCGKVKLAHPLFFSKNNSSQDGFYSTCRECRKVKTK